MSADSSIFVVVLGMVTTFIGLICIILLSKIMSFCCRIAKNTEKVATPSNTPSVATDLAPASANSNTQISNRGEFVAAISAAIAEELGKDVSSIRILSIKKV